MSNLRFAPEFRLHIKGAPIPAALRSSISSVSLQTALEGADRLEMTLVNENLRWLDYPLLRMDNQIAFSLGYAPDPLVQMFVGTIVAQGSSFPSSGAPTLTVTAHDRREHLQEGTKDRWFGFSVPTVGNFPIPDMEVMRQVSAENQLIAVFEALGAALAAILGGIEAIPTISDQKEAQKLIRSQSGESDFDLLTRVAKENGMDMLIEHDGPQGGTRLSFFSPLDHLKPDVNLKYGQSLLEFTPRISNVGQIASVTIFIWVAEIKTQFSVTLGWDWDRMALTLNIGAGLVSGGSGPSEVVINKPVSLASAPRKIVSELIPKLNKRLTGSGSTIGNPKIRAGSVLRMEGLGTQFGGLYRVTSATHTLDGSGYRTQFEVRKEIWFGSIPLGDQGAVPIRTQASFAN